MRVRRAGGRRRPCRESYIDIDTYVDNWRDSVPPRVIGLYSLALMEKEGPVYGYLVARRIAERTAGSWRPGAGAVYPALAALVERGLAARTTQGRRRTFRITPRGRTLLRRIRRDARGEGPAVPDLSVLWSDVVGGGEVGPHLLRRLRRTVDSIDSFLAQEPPAGIRQREFREQFLAELRLASARLSLAPTPSRHRHRAAGSRS
jgi:DNA-binding PadR family transcriptional regulator